ncbi:MAG: metallophosphoesterase [Planctomycetota bacterium]|nr:metallophosphoesterase [Planctomycetota bacterium]
MEFVYAAAGFLLALVICQATRRRAEETPRDHGLDIIGDVHGQAGKLERLLARMGYEEGERGWSHPTRRAVFVGDLVDGAGPRQVDAVEIARQMADSGSALVIAGNHEFNAVAWYLGVRRDDREDGGEGGKNYKQHRRFLEEVGERSARHGEIIEWFMSLPLWLEFPSDWLGFGSERGLRIVHACWDASAQATLCSEYGTTPRMSERLVRSASIEGSREWRAVEHLLKGPEVPVAPAYQDKGGHPRDHARFRWWDREAGTLDRAVQLPGGTLTAAGAPYPTLPAEPIDPPVPPYSDDEPPVLYGHYWMTGVTTRTGRRTACVDYSAGKGGKLVAYRWRGESQFDDSNFVASE